MTTLNRIRAAAVASFLLVALLPGTECDSSYCDICSDHTLCIYQGYGSACHKVVHSGTTGADATSVVEAHNRLRDRVAAGRERRGRPGPQPPAADMNTLVWDDELARIAQRWADQCTFGHDSCRDVERFTVGQNVYLSSTTGPIRGAEWSTAVQAWYDEVRAFSKNNINKYQFSAATGHYSQVVWGNTKYIGCGYTVYNETSRWTTQLYVCNYGPSGNFIGRRVYTIGKSCSRCPGGCHSTYSSLCA
ncbi:venom allergen 5-like [Schistocerca americana]|uniref:venom allergen 5-like n=1 Tax=Schistocerca americana TaxID=7009 RepID=UPI001F4FC0E1|nr:venom allergen 5-like [Schistocerca americana]